MCSAFCRIWSALSLKVAWNNENGEKKWKIWKFWDFFKNSLIEKLTTSSSFNFQSAKLPMYRRNWKKNRFAREFDFFFFLDLRWKYSGADFFYPFYCLDDLRVLFQHQRIYGERQHVVHGL